MILILSKHAVKRMADRGISEDIVRSVLENPDKRSQSGISGQYLSSKKVGRKAIVVIYTETDNVAFVVTVFSSSKLNKYL